ncbi:hypothetical protein Q8X48_13240 [Pseudomonas sp. QLc11A]|uniref:SMODS-associating 2TM beta-strand rich effector domain-containing protein n=1 Tax=Pseudomonas azerbaijanorientalis TaxID=2842350 RepID=A0ABW8W5X3_9PSED
MQPFERWAGVITSAYLSLFLAIIIARGGEVFSLPLNELGDFAAGVFAPLAFLWLVLGYRQQGKELRESSVALRTQSEELKKSVTLQAEANARNDKLHDPILDMVSLGKDQNNPECDNFKIINEKNTCYNVTIRFESSEGGDSGEEIIGTLLEGSGRIFKSYKNFDNKYSVVFINYTRLTGTCGSQTFMLTGILRGCTDKIILSKWIGG